MIYVNDKMFKVSFACNTDDQSSVEDFILTLGRNYHGDKNSMNLSETPLKNTYPVPVKIKRNKVTKRLTFILPPREWCK